MGVFSGYCVALELGSAVPYKTKKEIRQLITSHGGIISFVINKKVQKYNCSTFPGLRFSLLRQWEAANKVEIALVVL